MVGSIPSRRADPLQGHSEKVTIPISAPAERLANDVGYESEPSFNRVFKRESGVPPVRFRIQTRRVHGKN